MEQMSEWPNTWQVDEPDLPYGEGLLAEFKPFVTHLVTVGVNGTLANLPQFQQAFHIPAGSPMVNAHRCVIC